jgi:hypothetical protein
MKVQPAVEPLVLVLRLDQLQEVSLRQVLQVNVGFRFFLLILVNMAVLELAILIKVTKWLFCFLICWIISQLVIIPTMIRVLPIWVELLFFHAVLILLTLSIWIGIFHRLVFSKNFFAFVLFIYFFCFFFSIG